MFDAEVLAALDAAEEVEIETSVAGRAASGEADSTTHRTIIWVMVEGGDVFIRSVRGETGRWYRDLQADPACRLHVPGLAEPVTATAVPAADPASVERCSAALRAKYRPDPALGSMLEPKTLPTTIILRPGEPAPGAPGASG